MLALQLSRPFPRSPPRERVSAIRANAAAGLRFLSAPTSRSGAATRSTFRAATAAPPHFVRRRCQAMIESKAEERDKAPPRRRGSSAGQRSGSVCPCAEPAVGRRSTWLNQTVDHRKNHARKSKAGSRPRGCRCVKGRVTARQSSLLDSKPQGRIQRNRVRTRGYTKFVKRQPKDPPRRARQPPTTVAVRARLSKIRIGTNDRGTKGPVPRTTGCRRQYKAPFV